MTASSSIPENARMLTHQQVCEYVQIPDRTLRLMVSAGRFPKPVKLGTTMQAHVRYDREEIEAWIRALKEER
jgi:excisionase family DNA binding protein